MSPRRRNHVYRHRQSRGRHLAGHRRRQRSQHHALPGVFVLRLALRRPVVVENHRRRHPARALRRVHQAAHACDRPDAEKIQAGKNRPHLYPLRGQDRARLHRDHAGCRDPRHQYLLPAGAPERRRPGRLPVHPEFPVESGERSAHSVDQAHPHGRLYRGQGQGRNGAGDRRDLHQNLHP